VQKPRRYKVQHEGGLFTPHIVFERIHDVDPQFLLELGKTAALVDLDNTLLAWGDEEMDPEVTAWVQSAKEAGLRLCMLSNTRSWRAAYYALELGIPYVGGALKPSRQAARGAMRLLKSTPENTAIIGDQIFTDVLLGRRLGLFTVLVRPANLREQYWMRLVRRVERLFWPRFEDEVQES
jgi:HAD superfamily phosphatase (TIGR01668 family)